MAHCLGGWSLPKGAPPPRFKPWPLYVYIYIICPTLSVAALSPIVGAVFRAVLWSLISLVPAVVVTSKKKKKKKQIGLFCYTHIHIYRTNVSI